MNFTPAQQAAIDSRGNVLVMAGAGTGKTRTLVERCLRRLLDPQDEISLDAVLMVTFTEAAAAEIRQRIRDRLEAELDRQPDPSRLFEQLALLDAAQISTLHSFCLKLVRQNFYALELDPQLTVLAQDQAQLLAAEILEELLNDHYAGRAPNAAAVQELIQVHSRGWDEPIRELILQLHEYTQTRPDPAGWFQRELDRFSQPDPAHWRRWLIEGFAAWRELWVPVLQAQPPENVNAHTCADVLAAATLSPTGGEGRGEGAGFAEQGRTLLPPTSPPPGDGSEAPSLTSAHPLAATLAAILAQDIAWPTKRKTAFRKPLEKFFEDARFLSSLMPDTTCPDPLAEDWGWIRHHMAALLQLAREFTQRFSAAKRERGALDFHDLEQFALRLLWDFPTRQTTALAAEWRERFKLVFVDEYQDINEAQDRILTALGRDVARANRFLVGDVKQSIYRFRQANPRIFQGAAERWRAGVDGGQTIDLADNFRSHEALLQFVNPLFTRLMRRDLGGIEYDQAAQLRFGNPADRAARRTAPGSAPRVEVHLRLTSTIDPADPDDAVGNLSNAEKEARLIGLRLRALRDRRHAIWDDALKAQRPVDWRDMVILLRSPAGKVEGYAKQFASLDVPLQAKRTGFYESAEVRDLLSLLQLLDNPLQDVPVLAVLRSPLVGLSLNELAEIRLAARPEKFWTALQRWHAVNPAPESLNPSEGAPPRALPRGKTPPRMDYPGSASRLIVAAPEDGRTPTQSQESSQGSIHDPATWSKVDTFLGRFAHWRRLSRQASLAQRLELVLHETHYLDWLWTQSRGEQRQANVQQLLAVARDYDELHQPSLYRFLQFIEAQNEAALDREPAPLLAENAVRLMSIHQSKGLEFPVVVVADLGKPFNFLDLHGPIVLDEAYGLCPQVKPPDTGQHYPSLPLWLAKQRQRAETLGEELRVLYVALTRAQDTLLLAGTCPASTAGGWLESATDSPAAQGLLKANRYLDWLGPYLTAQAAGWWSEPAGRAGIWQWWTYPEVPSVETEATADASPAEGVALNPEGLQTLTQRMAWQYPHPEATQEPAKTTVTALRRRAIEEMESATPPFARVRSGPSHGAQPSQLSAAEVGLAHHRFLQWMSLDAAESVDRLQGERERLRTLGILTDAEAAAVNLSAVARFWGSELGVRIRQHAADVRRELPFTMRLTQADLVEDTNLGNEPQRRPRPADSLSPTGEEGRGEGATSEKCAAPGLSATPIEIPHPDPPPASPPPLSALPPDEFIVVQGVVDLAVLLPDQIWLVDFKTDDMTANEVAAKVEWYRPQLQLYGIALSKIYGRPVTGRWLHFLSPGVSKTL